MGSLLIVLSTPASPFHLFLYVITWENCGVWPHPSHMCTNTWYFPISCLFVFPTPEKVEFEKFIKISRCVLGGHFGSKLKKNRETIWMNYKEIVPWKFEFLNSTNLEVLFLVMGFLHHLTSFSKHSLLWTG